MTNTNTKPKGNYRLKTDEKLVGIFKSSGTYGFINNEVYVRKENMGTAFNKDKVEYVIIEYVDEDNDSIIKKPEGKIINVLERYKVEFVGEIIYRDEEKSYVLLDSSRINKIACINKTENEIGEKVKIRLTSFDWNNLEGTIIKTIGSKEDPKIDIISVLEDFGIKEKFSPEVLEEVEGIELDIEKHSQDPLRKDYTHIPFATVDPNESKDFDDAIAVLKNENNFVLYVGIADVWTYIKDKKNIIEEAINRGNSIYFLNNVVPMLHEKLSNYCCSLKPNEKRCSIVLKIEIDEKGNLLRNTIEVNPGIIKSQKRFNYEEINRYFSKKCNLHCNQDVKKSIDAGKQLFYMLEKNRIEKGYVNISVPETKLNTDDDGNIINIDAYNRGEAQLMIENFMIISNEIIANIFEENKIPSVYRVHERPDPSQIISFISEAKKLNFIIVNSEIKEVDQKTISRWLEDNKDNINIEAIQSLLLKSMQKAKYSVTNIGHFGLNLPNYVHFTSPIRRLSDTIVHRLLWEYIFHKTEIKDKHKLVEELQKLAQKCTQKEIESAEISKEIETMKTIKYLNKKVNNVYKGKIIGITKSGAWLNVPELKIDGLLRVFNMNLNIGGYVLVKPIYDKKEFKLIKVL